MAPPDSQENDPETLRERVRELEQTADDLRETVAELQQRRGPSRRDLLKVGSGGLLGAGLLASSQPVSAAPASSDTSAGQVGVAGDSEDVVLDQLRDPGGDEVLNVDDSGGINAQFGRTWHFDSVSAEKLNNTSVNAGRFSTVQSAIDEAESSNIAVVTVPSGDYTEDLNLPSGVTVVGGGKVNQANNTTTLTGSHTLQKGAKMERVEIQGTETDATTLAGISARVQNCKVSYGGGGTYGEVVVDADRCIVALNDFTFRDLRITANSTGSVVGLNAEVTITTDDGSNTQKVGNS